MLKLGLSQSSPPHKSAHTYPCLAQPTSAPSLVLSHWRYGLIGEFFKFPHQARSQTWISFMPRDGRPLHGIDYPQSCPLHVLAGAWPDRLSDPFLRCAHGCCSLDQPACSQFQFLSPPPALSQEWALQDVSPGPVLLRSGWYHVPALL